MKHLVCYQRCCSRNKTLSVRNRRPAVCAPAGPPLIWGKWKHDHHHRPPAWQLPIRKANKQIGLPEHPDEPRYTARPVSSLMLLRPSTHSSILPTIADGSHRVMSAPPEWMHEVG